MNQKIILNDLQIVQRKDINEKAWNELISNSPQGVLYALTWYLDVVSPNWQAIVYAPKGQYTIVMPLPIRQKYGLNFVQQPLFCQQLGVFSLEKVAIEVLDVFIQKLVQSYQWVSWYCFNTDNPTSTNLPIKQTIFTTHHLALYQKAEKNIEKYNRDRKMNLKRALKTPMKIVESTDIQPLIAMFCEEAAQKIEGGVAENAYNLLQKVYATLHQNHCAKLLYTQEEDKYTAGVLLAYYQRHIIYLFNAAYHAYRKSNGRTLLIHKQLLSTPNYAPQATIFDFESPEKTPIAEFYESFGATPQQFLRISYNHLPTPIRLAQRLKQKLLSNKKE
jgi:hypothetical protein